MNELFAALPKLIGQMPDNPELRQAVVFAAFRRAAGPQLREHALPVRLDGEELYVAVADRVWERQLASLAPEFIYKVNASLGRAMVRYIRFEPDAARFGRSARAADVGDAGTAELSEEILNAAAAIRDADLRETFLRAAANTLAARKKNGR